MSVKDLELARELEAYNRMKEELIKKYEGKVVAIKNGKLIGVYSSEEEAFKDIVKKYGFTPVLIKHVSRKEKIEHLPAYTYGLLSVTVE